MCISGLIQAREQFLGQQFVGGGPGAVFIVVDDGLAEAGGFGQAGAAGDHGLEDPLAEMLAHFADDLLRELGAAVIHGHDHARELQPRIDAAVVQLGHDPVEHGDAFQGVVFALQRHEDAIGGGKSVEGEDAQRGRAIHQDNVKPLRIEHGAQGLRGALEVVV